MGWLSRLFGRVQRGADPRRYERYFLPWGASGVSLTGDQALSVATVWACIQVISQGIAACRWNIYQPLGNGKRQLLEEDPLAWKLNCRPNADMTAIGWREAMLMTAIPYGNAYAEVVKDRAGRVAELWPLEVERVMVKRDPDTWRLFYEYYQPDGTKVVLQSDQVFHLRGPGLSGLLGDNVLARAVKSISLAAAQERHAGLYFGQGATPTGVLEYPGKLSEPAFDRLKESFEEAEEKRYTGDKAHRPLILEEGMKWQSISVEPQKAQLVESRQFSVEEICRWFCVPPHKVQHLLRATYSNIEHSSLEFVRDALTPWCRRLEQEADAKLFRQDRGPWRYTSIDTAPLSYGDAKSRAEAAAIWRQNGVMSANEIRAREGLNDAGPDGDVLLVQSNMTTIDALLNPPEPVAALPPEADAAGPDGEVEGNDSVSEGDVAAAAEVAVVRLFAAAVRRYAGRSAGGRNRARHRERLLADSADLCLLAEKVGCPLSAATVLSAADRTDAGADVATAVAVALSTASPRLGP